MLFGADENPFSSQVKCWLRCKRRLSWRISAVVRALVEEAGQSRDASTSVHVSIHLGLRGGQGDCQKKSQLQRDPNAPITSFPDQKAAPQPADRCRVGSSSLGCGRQIEEQAQHKESHEAPPPWSLVAITTLVTSDPAEASSGDAITQRPQPAEEQGAKGGSPLPSPP